jgi:hypothetical protein
MDFLGRVFDELVARITSGPMQFRLIIQPTMALILGIRDGLADVKAGSPPFLWGLLFRRNDLKPSFQSAVRRLRVPVVVAILADATVQYLMFHHVRPLTAVIVGVLLMGVPYSASRGISNRIYSRLYAARFKTQPLSPPEKLNR